MKSRSGAMDDDADVIIVGARCAGSPLAVHLARRGLRVTVVERGRFPSAVPSTHLIHPRGVACLDRLGVLDRVLATGVPPLDRGSFQFDDVRLECGPEVMAGFEAPWLCVRRTTLDALLADHARQAGAQVRTGTGVVGLVEHDGAVRGVRTDAGTLRAPLVVGADGPSSTVARQAGAREYHVTAPGRFAVWGYFEHAAEPAGRSRLGQVGDVAYAAMPTDGGLFMAVLYLSMDALPEYLADRDGGFGREVARIEELAAVLGPAHRVGPLRMMSRWHGYFREARGPGWVLAGDAGHCKDPTPAQGISDALTQAERLAAVIEDGLGGSDLDGPLRRWGLQRDADAWEMYWFAALIGAPGPNPGLMTEMLRGLSAEPGGPEQLLRVLNRDLEPSTVFSDARGMRTLVRSALTRPRSLPRLVGETRGMVAADLHQRRLRRRPAFTDPNDREPAVVG